MQFGNFTTSNGSTGNNYVNVSFPRTFQATISVTCNLSDVGYGYQAPTTAVGPITVSTTGFQAGLKSSQTYGTVFVYWIAIGY